MEFRGLPGAVPRETRRESQFAAMDFAVTNSEKSREQKSRQVVPNAINYQTRFKPPKGPERIRLPFFPPLDLRQDGFQQATHVRPLGTGRDHDEGTQPIEWAAT